MPKTETASPPGGQLERGAMGVTDIVFFVLAGVAPMGVVVALPTVLGSRSVTAPVFPACISLAGIVLALFAVGYVRMSAPFTNAGRVLRLRHAKGSATASAARPRTSRVVAYNAATIGILGALAFFANQVMNQRRRDRSTVAGVGRRSRSRSSRPSPTSRSPSARRSSASRCLCEVGMLLAFDFGVLVHNGFHGFSLDVFKPSSCSAPGSAVTLMLAFGSYVGFEATALYGEEAKNPRRASPPRHLHRARGRSPCSTSDHWAAISAYGVNHAQAAAGARPPGVPVRRQREIRRRVHQRRDATLLVITSLFAAFLAFHCNTARYHYALAPRRPAPQGALAHPPQVRLADHRPAPCSSGSVADRRDRVRDRRPEPLPCRWAPRSTASACSGSCCSKQSRAPQRSSGSSSRQRKQGNLEWGTIIAPGLGALGLTTGLVFMIYKYYPTLTGNKKKHGSTRCHGCSSPPRSSALSSPLDGPRNREPAEYEHAQTADTADAAPAAPARAGASA